MAVWFYRRRKRQIEGRGNYVTRYWENAEGPARTRRPTRDHADRAGWHGGLPYNDANADREDLRRPRPLMRAEREFVRAAGLWAHLQKHRRGRQRVFLCQRNDGVSLRDRELSFEPPK